MTESTQTAPAPVESREVMDPRTGELVDLRRTEDAWLGDFLKWIRDLEAQAREAKAVISRELHERMDRGASWTRTDGRWRIKGQAPGAIEYDAELLEANLRGLVAEDVIEEAAVDKALEQVTEVKVRKRGVQALLKLPDERVKAAIKAAEIPSTANRRITLEEIPSAD